MEYKFKLNNPLTHLIDIELKIDCENDLEVNLVLPIWRPGRYEAANYSKNLRGIRFYDNQGNPLNFSKPDANTWRINTKDISSLHTEYQYFAYTMDAGNSWYDENLVYINFINCLLYDLKRANDPCSISLELPSSYQTACAIPIENNSLKTKDFYELVDSPLIASKQLTQLTYEVNNVPFNIWINGQHSLDTLKLKSDFEKFSKAQIDAFGEFPESVYHFLIIALPYKHYHGVEHARSTVICMGPGNELSNDHLYKELLGVSSHELFHAWNIIKIRPQEMMPYNFADQITFQTGYVAEGFTTYYGDLYLSKSGVFTSDGYFNELNTLFNRHFWNYGRFNESVVTSSINLWFDGYLVSAPHKKSSIYAEGAMIALCLDLQIRKETKCVKSLESVMRILWKNHGLTQRGYSLTDIKHYVEQVIGRKMSSFFDEYVYGLSDKQPLLELLLEYVGCQLKTTPNENLLTHHFGIRTVIYENEGYQKVIQAAPGSIGEQHFSINDIIQKVDNHAPNTFEFSGQVSVLFHIERNFEEKTIEVQIPQERYYNNFSINKMQAASGTQKKAFLDWCGQQF